MTACALLVVGMLGALVLAMPVTAAEASSVVVSAQRADGANLEDVGLEVVENDTMVLLAPVVGAPEAVRLGRGDRLVGEALVYGQSIDGSPRWYFVSVASADGQVRGFVHSSLVREAP